MCIRRRRDTRATPCCTPVLVVVSAHVPALRPQDRLLKAGLGARGGSRRGTGQLLGDVWDKQPRSSDFYLVRASSLDVQSACLHLSPQPGYSGKCSNLCCHLEDALTVTSPRNSAIEFIRSAPGLNTTLPWDVDIAHGHLVVPGLLAWQPGRHGYQ